MLSSFVALGLDQLCVSNLLVLLRLLLNYGELVFFKNFHARLVKSLLDKNIEHGLNFLVEIKKFVIAIVDLGRFTVFLGGHTRLEKWDWGSVEVELCGDTNFGFIGLISKVLLVFVGLE